MADIGALVERLVPLCQVHNQTGWARNMLLTPKNWNSFQHYTNRSPAWIKLHRELLDDFEFSCLPVASQALAPKLWLLASEYEKGVINASLDKIAFRMRMTRGDLAEALTPLLEKGFFDASEPLAECKPNASLEREEEREKEREEEKEKETRASALLSDDRFSVFWDEWPNKVGRPAALKAFKSAIKRSSFEEIMDGLRFYVRSKPPDRSWLNPATFLNQDRWQDRPAPTAKPLTEHQQKRRETQDILDALDKFSGREGSEANPRLLPGDSGERPEGVRSGSGANLIELPAIRIGARG